MTTHQNHPETTQRILVDVSPILYSNLISVSNQFKSEVEVDPETGKLPFIYKSELIFAIFEEIKNLRNLFNTKEVILAFDNVEDDYWRKQVYNRYKYSRKKKRDDSVIDWSAAFEVFDEIKNLLKNSTSFKCLDVPSMEADDCAFVLAEYFQDKGGCTMVSLDGDWRLTLQYDNIQLFKTRKTQKKDGIYEEMTLEEVKEKEQEMIIGGDSKDGMLHIMAWTQFSPEFLKEHPKFKGKEEALYDKHHIIEHKFNLKHNFDSKIQAYKHPRFGYKSFKKSNKVLSELLKDPIVKKNYERNKLLCLPSEIPKEYRETIIQHYENAPQDKDAATLTSYFMSNNLFELTGIVGIL